MKKVENFHLKSFMKEDSKADPSVLRHFCALEGFWPMGPQCHIAFCDIEGKEEGASSHHKAHQESKCNRIEADKIAINRLMSTCGYITINIFACRWILL